MNIGYCSHGWKIQAPASYSRYQHVPAAATCRFSEEEQKQKKILRSRNIKISEEQKQQNYFWGAETMRTLSQSLVIQNLKADHELSSTRWGCTTRKYKALVAVEQERRTKTPHWLGRRAATGAAAATAAASERASEQASRKEGCRPEAAVMRNLERGKTKANLGFVISPSPLPPPNFFFFSVRPAWPVISDLLCQTWQPGAPFFLFHLLLCFSKPLPVIKSPIHPSIHRL